MSPFSVSLESYSSDRDPASYAFAAPCGQVQAHRAHEVRPAIEEVERAVSSGLHAAGFLTYEAASGLDPVLQALPAGELPLVWFGLFRERHCVDAGSNADLGTYQLTDWRPSICRTRYDRSIRRIQEHIRSGDTYQVNYTFRMSAGFSGDDRALYADLCRSQRASFCAYVDLGRHRILSASPELFFSLANGEFRARPMKGTRPRGRWPREDEELRQALRSSEKDKAENLMIVDLLRNDLGRISETGSVTVPSLWDVERYETVYQMTSAITSRLRRGTGLSDILRSLFPCGSVTGAPKVKTMQIISEQEGSPRGVYTGSIGFVSPGPEICFNVAIRTVWIDTQAGRAEFGVGGGITTDSSEDGEYEECMVKSRVLTSRRPDFELLETLRHDPGQGYALLDGHLSRLRLSSEYFGFRHDPDGIRQALEDAVQSTGGVCSRVRLLVSRSGEARCEQAPLTPPSPRPLRAAACTDPVDSHDPMLFHKTTHREAYDKRLARRPDCDELILQNERGEATECCIGNLVAVIRGQHYTPPLSSGLLPGVFRAEMLAQGRLRERVLEMDDLRRAESLHLINSVRGWIPLELAD